MTHQLRSRDIIALSFITSVSFVDADNIIFPPVADSQTGGHTWTAAFSLPIIVVGPLVLVVAVLAKVGDGVDNLSTPVGKVTGVPLVTVCYLVVGPLSATPRIAIVSSEVGVVSLAGDSVLLLFVYSLVYFTIVILVSFYPGKLLDTMGNFLAPLEIIALVIPSVVTIIWPTGSISMVAEAYQNAAFPNGFINGHLTMDTSDAIVLSIAIASTACSCSATEARLLTRYTVWAGSMVGVGLTLLYLALFRSGSDGTSLVNQSADGAAILYACAQHIFGGDGSFLPAALILITCLVTAVGLTCARTEFFAQYIPPSHRTLVFILGGFPIVVSNLDLSQLTQVSVLVLTAIYPPYTTLAILGFICSWWHNSPRVIAPPIFINSLFGVPDGTKVSAFGDILPSWVQCLPSAEQGLVWLMLTAVVVILTIIWDCAAGHQATSSAH